MATPLDRAGIGSGLITGVGVVVGIGCSVAVAREAWTLALVEPLE